MAFHMSSIKGQDSVGWQNGAGKKYYAKDYCGFTRAYTWELRNTQRCHYWIFTPTYDSQ